MEKFRCWRCNKDLEFRREPLSRVFCEECQKEHNNEHKQIVSEYAKLKIDIMYENALRIMEKANTYMYEYERAAKEIYKKAINRPAMFYSSHEMVAAIVLQEYGFEFEVNHTILKYRVDLYIPELKVCLEIDGHLHDMNQIYDSNRDVALRNHLGADWEIIRIPTKYLEMNPSKIPDAIESLKKEKINIRKENSGIIPEWFSTREKKHYSNLLSYKSSKAKKQEV